MLGGSFLLRLHCAWVGIWRGRGDGFLRCGNWGK